MRGPEPRLAERPAAPPAGALPAHGPPVAREVGGVARRGLSVAEAARASTLAFQPLRRSPDLIGDGALRAPDATPPGEPVPPVTPGRVAPRARFAKTIAELERYQAAAASRWEEPGGRIVPRPALARPDQGDSAGSPWSRLWARRKDHSAG